MSSKKIDITIIKNGKDICRLIFTQFYDGLFDIKINARENSFRVQTYSLFSTRPMEVYPDNLKAYKEHEITYHHGAENKPIVVHIKNMMPQYFCTNTILSGSQKMNTYIPHKPENRCTIVNGLEGMAVMVNYNPESSLDKRRKSMYFTFIENEYAEDILMNTILVYPEADENGCFPSLFAGGATIRDLSILTGRNKQERIEDAFGKMKNSNGSMSGRLRYTAVETAKRCTAEITK